MEDKQIELLNDIRIQDEDDEELSCCGVGMNGDYRICEACGEHC